MMIQENQIDMFLSDLLKGLFAGASLNDGMAIRGQRRSQNATDLGFVVDHKNHGGVHDDTCRSECTGSVKENTDPRPSWLVTLIVPP
jgi:hypothetical protein